MNESRLDRKTAFLYDLSTFLTEIIFLIAPEKDWCL